MYVHFVSFLSQLHLIIRYLSMEEEIKQLIIQAKSGDTEAFGVVYNKYLTPIYRYIYLRVRDKDLADDLTQDVFIKVFNSLGTFTIRNGSPLSYFYTVARNVLIDNYRKKKNVLISEEELEGRMVDEDTPEKQSILKDTVNTLSKALETLSENESEAITLKFIENYSNKEIGEIMGKSEEAVRQLQSRGMKALRITLKKEDL